MTNDGDQPLFEERGLGFVLIRSWHLRSGLVSRGGMIHTLCGRWASKDAKTAPGLPTGKSCESCLRLQVQAAA